MRITLLLLASLQVTSACEVIITSASRARKQADVVFRGTIVEVRPDQVHSAGAGGGTIVFKVERVWKGHVTAKYEMENAIWVDSPCLPGFRSSQVSVGQELLVFAVKPKYIVNTGAVPLPGWPGGGIEYCQKTLQQLGRGHPPAKQ